MSIRLDSLQKTLAEVFGEKISHSVIALDELSIQCKPADLIEVCITLKNHASFKFEQLIDLCGVDYSDYSDGTYEGLRYASVLHLLSVEHNHRLRVKTFAQDDDFPVLPTLVDVWSVANWFERESFDLYGLMYENHPDLRRLLTDYGFVGHPFRKDFPMIGNVEMRYDPEQQRVIYQPVSIELRNNVPRVIRDDGAHK